MRDPLLHRPLVKERCKTQAKHSHTSIKVPMGVETHKSSVQLGSELVNVSLSSGCRGITSGGWMEGKVPGTRCCPSGRPMSACQLDPALADCHRLITTSDQVQHWQTGNQADADSSNPRTTGKVWRGLWKGDREKEAGITECREQLSYNNSKNEVPTGQV